MTKGMKRMAAPKKIKEMSRKAMKKSVGTICVEEISARVILNIRIIVPPDAVY